MKCLDCKWWINGDCHKHAPTVIIDGYEIGACGHLSVFPQTDTIDYCGDFEDDKS